MPSGNRVEELETRVAELEATVQGLTEELVEANDRIRQLESALGTEPAVATPDERDDAATDADLEAAVDNDRVEIMGLEQEVGVEDDAEPVESGDDSAETAAQAAEAAKEGGDESPDEGDVDDIIVA